MGTQFTKRELQMGLNVLMESSIDVGWVDHPKSLEDIALASMAPENIIKKLLFLVVCWRLKCCLCHLRSTSIPLVALLH